MKTHCSLLNSLRSLFLLDNFVHARNNTHLIVCAHVPTPTHAYSRTYIHSVARKIAVRISAKPLQTRTTRNPHRFPSAE